MKRYSKNLMLSDVEESSNLMLTRLTLSGNTRPRSWCWKIHFETKKQSEKWEDWSFVHFSVTWNWII